MGDEINNRAADGQVAAAIQRLEQQMQQLQQHQQQQCAIGDKYTLMISTKTKLIFVHQPFKGKIL